MIRIQGLRKRHGEIVILDGIDASVERGQTVALVGPSGGGKSTLLRSLNYLEPFDEGKIEIAGFALEPGMGRGHSDLLRGLRTAVGMVFQQFHLFPHLTAVENVMLAPVHVRKQERGAAEKRARELLERVGLGGRATARPPQLSGGQQQRVAIARALAQEPKVLLFDEPTSALDPEMRDEVLDVMKSLPDDITQLVVTHEMHFAHQVADVIWVMSGGKIVEAGPPDEVVDRPQSDVAREYFKRVAASRREG